MQTEKIEKTELNWDKFEPLFSTWASKLKPFFIKGGFDPIYEFLKKESARGKKISPDSKNVFRAFQETDINNLKVVLLSYCPYHTFYNNIPCADGLAFSCSITGKMQPSLDIFYQGLECDLKDCLHLNYTKSPDLTYLAKEGVFLWNAALTVEQNKAGSHQSIWEPFTKYVLEECLAYTGIPIVFIGKDAAKYKKYVTPLTHEHIFEIEHPAYAARVNDEWDTKGVFSKINRIVYENNGYKINWFNEENNEIPF